MTPIGLYLHVPFCRSGKCPYCDFYSIPFTEEQADAYTSALIRAMARQPFGGLTADTLYLGGGTPSLLGAKRLDTILQTAVSCFGLDSHSEITLEANPESLSLPLLQSLRNSGFTRISIGVQSGVDVQLQALGRPHTAAQAARGVEWAHQAGFAHISADWMLAIPQQTEETLRESAAFFTALPVDHISAYLLKIEEGTPYHRLRDQLSLPGEDAAAEEYLLAVTLLEEAGFARYEISNFAKPGGQSRHNLKYWSCEPYLGLGPSAHSLIGGKRCFFDANLDAFLAADNPCILLNEEGAGGELEEQLMLALRLTQGFDAKQVKNPVAKASLLCKAQELATHGLCRVEGEQIALTKDGFLLSNPVTVALLEALEADET